ncbi:MAG: class II fumarate hydratase [Cellulomonadaceae bacterium]|jgi:fumarate hydratase class II|nr:class II fumarate hydratase [Cellulomonadaceae bacterium]
MSDNSTLPKDALYGKQTALAVANFPISGQRFPTSLIHALAQVKKAAAKSNAQLGTLDPKVADAIVAAADKVISDSDQELQTQFPVDIYQTGSGTSTNMNMNEVLANIAGSQLGQDVHPNDQVNASQSTNDVFPTAIHIAAANSLENKLIPALSELFEALAIKAEELNRVVKAGRTHLMDATPVTLGQEFGGYAASISHAIERLSGQIEAVCEVALGGTAVGTGLNAPKGYPQTVIEKLAEITDLPIREANNHFEAQGTQDSLVELSGALKTLAVSLTKICNDLRWMSSGPTAGLGEISLPELQAGSSIMPGKVNPVIPEAVLQVCSRVVGNDATIAWAGASGNFELNVQMPIIGAALLESIELLSNACTLLAEKCVSGITANVEKAQQYALSSPAIVTALNPIIGYDKAAEIAKYAVANHSTIKQAALDLGFVARGELTEDQLDDALDPIMMC